MSFQKTAAQFRATQLLASNARHVLLYGGSRSGKTFEIVRAICVRACREPSRHAIWRLRFNHVKSSIFSDTLPKVLKLCFPEVKVHFNKTELISSFPNGSEIWLGGLDNAERVEKVLGQEFATVYFNECSQIPYDSVTVALSRLAQKTALVNRAWYDCNPPSKRHWTYKLFVEGVNPETGHAVNPGVYAAMLMNPQDNAVNLSPDYIDELERMPPKKRARFLLGEFSDDREDALFNYGVIRRGPLPKKLRRVVVAIDPAMTAKIGSDETGIIVCGVDHDGIGYVMHDGSLKGKPPEWGRAAVNLAAKFDADAIVAETNNGGDMVEHTLRSVGYKGRYIKVTATRGKALRAEPVSALYHQGLVYHCGDFDALEVQMCDFTLDYDRESSGSPDRLDALVWGLTQLMVTGSRYNHRALA